MRKLLLFVFSLLLLQHAHSKAGQLDPSYGNGGVTAPLPEDPDFDDMVIQPDGKIVATGVVSLPDFGGTFKSYIVRYTTDGKLDKTFSGDGILSDPFLNVDDMGRSALAVQKDGKLLAAGPNFGVVRYNPNGTPDATFGNGGYVSTDPAPGGQEQAISIAVTKDGKILVAGNHYPDDSNSPPHATLVTYLPNGTVESIQVFYSGFEYEAYPALAAYKSGGYALLGHGDASHPYLYSSKFGQADVPLKNPYGPAPAKIAILENEKIAISVYHRDDVTDEIGTYLAVLNTDGTLDKSFSGDGVIENPSFTAVAAQKDGKIIVGAAGGINRYNADGSLDITMTPPAGLNGIRDIIAYGNRIYALGRNRVVAFQLDSKPRTVKVNLFGGTNPYINGEWNNWNTFSSLNAGTLYYTDSTASAIHAVLSARNGVVDNGSSYTGGIAPAHVLRYGSYATAARTLTLSGLSTGRRYSIELYASRNAASNDTTTFAINGVLKKIGSSANHAVKAVFSNLTPNASGQIVISIGNIKAYNYLNGFVLTETYTAPATSAAATTMVMLKEPVAASAGLQALVFPNPTQRSFTLQLKSGSKAPVQVRILDAAGRVVEQKQNATANTLLTVGQQYKPGVYYAEIKQGNESNVVKLVKQ